ncbi:MAG: helix-turn-helix domain-containing protein [Bacteroidota bacterium]
MKTRFWVLHIVPVLVGIIALGIVFPYWSYYELWSGKIIHLIYFQWFIYIVFTTYELRAVLKRLITRNDKNNSLEIWLLSVYFGILSIWLAYATSSFTSYIVGAISFSFFLYLLILIWFLKLNKDRLFFETKGKYENRKVKKDTIESIMGSLSTIEKKKLYQNPNIKLSDVASELNVVPHILSQVLNEHLGKSFSVFINEYRVEKAKKMLVENELYTIEGIGLDSGFKSKSAFFKSFKTITGTTPAKYRDSHRAI